MTKKLERKVEELESWIAQFEAGNDDKLVFTNMNFLITQLKTLGDRLGNVEQSHRQVEGVIQQNAQVVNDFISEQELEEVQSQVDGLKYQKNKMQALQN